MSLKYTCYYDYGDEKWSPRLIYKRHNKSHRKNGPYSIVSNYPMYCYALYGIRTK